MPTKKSPTPKKTANSKSSRSASSRFKPAPKSRFDALRKPALLIIITLAATVGVYFTFFASAASGNPTIVSIAASQVGQTNGCKYETGGSTCPYPGLWCAYFASWVYKQAGYPAVNFSSVYGLRTYFQGHAVWHNRGDGDVPQPGDVITFSSDSHAGIVDHVDGTTLYTIEGNYSHKVSRVSYANYSTYGAIVGWGRLSAGSPPVGGNPATSSANEYFIKTLNVPATVEIHRASAASNYQSADLHTRTWFSSGDAGNGTWQMVGSDLYFIKTVGGANGHVEVHSATAASGYQSGVHYSTWFSSGDAGNGTWQMVGSDLYFIKTVGGANGHVEVHSATAASGYQSGVHYSTWFSSGDAGNGTWQMVGSDLYFIKTVGGANGHVEVHSATAASGYQSGVHYSTWFSSGDAGNGTWQMVGSDLYFIKTVGGANGHVEVHSATAASGYQSGVHYSTWFSSGDAVNGTWKID